FNVHAAEVPPPDTLGHAGGAREEVACGVEPGIVTIACGFDHQRIAFPMRDGVAIPRRQHIVGELAAIEEDLAVAGIELVQDRELSGRLAYLLTLGKHPGAREVGWHTVRVWVDECDLFRAALDEVGGPRLVWEPLLKACSEVNQPRRQRKLGALD